MNQMNNKHKEINNLIQAMLDTGDYEISDGSILFMNEEKSKQIQEYLQLPFEISYFELVLPDEDEDIASENVYLYFESDCIGISDVDTCLMQKIPVYNIEKVQNILAHS